MSDGRPGRGIARGAWRGGVAALALCLVAQGALAQGQSGPPDAEYPYARAGDDANRFSVRTGIGFTADPDTFLLGFEGDYTLGDHVSAGALVQLGVDDDVTLVSPVAYGRFRFDLGEIDPAVEPVELYLQTGLGFTHWDIDRRGFRGDDDDTEFLLNFGFGVEYRLSDEVSVGTHMLFNIVPNEIFDERFYYSWEVATLRYRF